MMNVSANRLPFRHKIAVVQAILLRDYFDVYKANLHCRHCLIVYYMSI